MQLDISDSRGWTVIRPDGDLTADTVPDFKKLAMGLIAEGHRQFILNLRDVGYVDSAGLGTMVFILKRVKKGNLVIAAVNDRIIGLLEITGLDANLDVTPSVEQFFSTLASS